MLLEQCQRATANGSVTLGDSSTGVYRLANSNRKGLLGARGRTYEGCIACPALSPMAAAGVGFASARGDLGRLLWWSRYVCDLVLFSGVWR